MHAFTWPSHQLRLKVRDTVLRCFHQTSLYRRFILTNKDGGAQTIKAGKAIHTRLMSNHWEGTTLLKFVHCLLHNSMLAERYGHAPTYECPLCYKPDSCAHIAEERPFHKALTISRHNTACQLIHAAIRKAAKGGSALYCASDIVLLNADTGSQPQITKASL
jgi:hypothetical protein